MIIFLALGNFICENVPGNFLFIYRIWISTVIFLNLIPSSYLNHTLFFSCLYHRFYYFIYRNDLFLNSSTYAFIYLTSPFRLKSFNVEEIFLLYNYYFFQYFYETIKYLFLSNFVDQYFCTD